MVLVLIRGECLSGRWTQMLLIYVMKCHLCNNLLPQGKEEMLTSIPFARPQDSGPSVAIVTKVNRIQDQLVKKHDIELHMHLNRLEIAPQIYGMSVSAALLCLILFPDTSSCAQMHLPLFVRVFSRWVRLLFGREFPLQDLLVVWDALFADSITLDLVDYIFVAMLLYIRDARTLYLLLE